MVALDRAWLGRSGIPGLAPQALISMGVSTQNICPALTALLSGRSVKFNKGYTALSQTPDENLVSLDSDR